MVCEEYERPDPRNNGAALRLVIDNCMGDTGGKFRIAGAYYLPLRPAGQPGKVRKIWIFKGYNPEEWSLYDLIKG